MIATSKYYEHNTIGFPAIKLKWLEERNVIHEPYVTIKGVIQKTGWRWKHTNPIPYYQDEMERFDKWVRDTYSEDISVQG